MSDSAEVAHAQNDADDTAGMAVTLDEADLSGSNLTRDEASRLLAPPCPMPPTPATPRCGDSTKRPCCWKSAHA
ncbi:hypothetical protein [Candidatus Aalborgicola defluviihabitans]|uniref:hypothetical protein n=1 Tax=Candidatus Aalborgicola defluviihabitans TaxID=3386187 RepID=UPI001EC92582|nr:hypothetical protein [Burkholderiales bacterium]